MEQREFWVRAVVTILIVVAALFVILSDSYPPDTKHWAFIALGAVLGSISEKVQWKP